MLGQEVLDVNPFADHVRDAMSAQVGPQKVVLPEEGTHSDPRCLAALGLMVEAQELPAEEPPREQ